MNTVLERLSAHLDGLADEVHHIEHAVGEELSGAVYNGSDNIMRLQRLDFLRQSLEDMALLTLEMAHCRQDRVEADLVEKLRLDASRAMLFSAPKALRSCTNDAVDDGEVDFF